jgi:hypothetical protein
VQWWVDGRSKKASPQCAPQIEGPGHARRCRIPGRGPPPPPRPAPTQGYVFRRRSPHWCKCGSSERRNRETLSEEKRNRATRARFAFGPSGESLVLGCRALEGTFFLQKAVGTRSDQPPRKIPRNWITRLVFFSELKYFAGRRSIAHGPSDGPLGAEAPALPSPPGVGLFPIYRGQYQRLFQLRQLRLYFSHQTPIPPRRYLFGKLHHRTKCFGSAFKKCPHSTEPDARQSPYRNLRQLRCRNSRRASSPHRKRCCSRTSPCRFRSQCFSLRDHSRAHRRCKDGRPRFHRTQ